MIVTLTANPSLDRTASLDRPLARGEVHRVSSVTVEPGGKGINVARVAHAAGHPVRAILPAGLSDPILHGLDELRVPYRTVPLAEGVRTNLTLTEPDGTTTKINEPGPSLDAESIEKLAHLLVLESERADWVVLSGSLPPGVPAGWYADLVRALRPWGCRIAVDTSDAPLLALAAQFPDAAPDLLKPNSEELAQLTGADPELLEAAAAAGDPSACVEAARTLVAQGSGRGDGHPRRCRGRAGHRRRRLVRHPAADHPAQHRRCGRLLRRRLRAGPHPGPERPGSAPARRRLRLGRCLPGRDGAPASRTTQYHRRHGH